MVRVLETQTVAPNSIPLSLHAVLELNKHSLTLPCSVVVLLCYWKSEHDETRKLVMGQWNLAENLRFTSVLYHLPRVSPKQLCAAGTS